MGDLIFYYWPIINLILFGVFFILIIFIIILVIRSLLKYLKSKDVRKEKSEFRTTLGETLKQERISHKMTQEFVAETIGVSRQAVSKWENGVSAEDLLKDIGRD